ncbi:uncharacterized protein LOC134221308 [Armigeres subalbatus]|uniref:uncharacterized protein LOC134221308 n=1 Tax=Armigeres subalbatus TaxID=124917 RepID=UPI002ED44BA2
MGKLRRWLKSLANKSPISYQSLDSNSLCSSTGTGDIESAASVDNLYEDIENSNAADLRDPISYSLYLRQHFIDLRHLSAPQNNGDMSYIRNISVAASDEDVEQYQFNETDLLKRARNKTCSQNLPRICIRSSETIWRKPNPTASFESWYAGWVFRTDMNKLERQSKKRVKDRLSDGTVWED